MKFPLIGRRKARERLKASLDAMISHMYISGMHNDYSISQMKKLILERFDD